MNSYALFFIILGIAFISVGFVKIMLSWKWLKDEEENRKCG